MIDNGYKTAFYDVTPEQRSELPGLSYSGLKQLLITPAHYLAYKNKVRTPPTPAMIFGTAVDLAIFEHDKFKERVFVNPHKDKRTNKYKDWMAALPEGAIDLPQGEGTPTNPGIDVLRAMVDALANKPRIMEVLQADGVAQATGLAKDPFYDFFWKICSDWLAEETVFDYKTAASATYSSFSKAIVNFGYDLQAGLYQWCAEAITGVKHQFKWIVQEKTPPYDARIFVADNEMLDAARSQMKRAAAAYATCIEYDEWPGYSDDEIDMSLPFWKLKELGLT